MNNNTNTTAIDNAAANNNTREWLSALKASILDIAAERGLDVEVIPASDIAQEAWLWEHAGVPPRMTAEVHLNLYLREEEEINEIFVEAEDFEALVESIPSPWGGPEAGAQLLLIEERHKGLIGAYTPGRLDASLGLGELISQKQWRSLFRWRL